MLRRAWINLFSCCCAMLLFSFRLSGAGESSVPQKLKAGTSWLIYFGTYTDAASKGIYAYHFNPDANHFESLGLAAELASPAWLTVHPNHKFLYAVSYDGKGEGSIFSYRIDARTGRLAFLNKVSAGGGEPIHLAVDRTGNLLLDANYVGGQVVVFRLNQDGTIGLRTAFIQHTGSSVNPSRQRSPHPHEVTLSADNRYVIVPDLGVDKLFMYRLDPKAGTLAAGSSPVVALPAGSGPRHFAFHPNGRFGYLVSELDAAITSFAYTSATGELRPLQTLSTVPDKFAGDKSASEVWVDRAGRYLYASDRSDDALLVFSIDPRQGTLTKVQSVPSQGKTPRHFTADPTGQYLFVGNQKSDSVVIFKIDPASGKLSPTGQTLSVPTPTCVVFVPENR
jgi:6-phosphogluconolactonase